MPWYTQHGIHIACTDPHVCKQACGDFLATMYKIILSTSSYSEYIRFELVAFACAVSE